MKIVSWLIGQGAVYILPIFMLILSAIFRADFKKSVAGALKIAVGFTALNAMLGVVFGGMEPAVASFVNRVDANFTVLDLGWPTFTALGWAIPWGMFAVVGFFILNLVFLLIGQFKTLNADFNNYWEINLYMFMIYIATDSAILAGVSGVLFWIINMYITDWFTPVIPTYYGIEGISVPHYCSMPWAPIGFFLDKIWDSIPGIRNINWRADEIQKKFGFFGEPIFMGFVMGFFVGAISYIKLPFNLDDLASALNLGFTVSFFMYTIPRCAELVVSGMGPLSDAVREFVAKRLPGKEYYIGVDVAVLIGAAEHTAIGVLTTPIAFLLAFLLPGNQVLPMGDVAGLFIFVCVFITNTCKGNIFRALLSATLVYIPVSMYISGDIAPLCMKVIEAINYPIPESGFTSVVSICLGNLPLLYGFLKISIFIAGNGTIVDLLIGLACVAFNLVPWYIMRNRPQEYIKELEAEKAAS